jgi:hypothetical protein
MVYKNIQIREYLLYPDGCLEQFADKCHYEFQLFDDDIKVDHHYHPKNNLIIHTYRHMILYSININTFL